MDKNQILHLVAGVLLIFTMAYIFTKSKPQNCETYANNFKDNYVFHLVLRKKELESRKVKFYGYDPVSKADVKVVDDRGYLISKFKLFNIGDTVLKIKGEYKITIRRYKARKIIINTSCGGKIFAISD